MSFLHYLLKWNQENIQNSPNKNSKSWFADYFETIWKGKTIILVD